MNRKLAVPLALGKFNDYQETRLERSRVLKGSYADPEDIRTLMQLADNRVRIERLAEDIENDPDMEVTDDLKSEMDYINTSIQLGLLEITGELEEIQSSEDIFEEAATS